MIINGEEKDLKEGITIIDMLETLGLNKDKVVVEINLDIIPKDKYSQMTLNKKDKIEIVGFIGGG